MQSSLLACRRASPAPLHTHQAANPLRGFLKLSYPRLHGILQIPPDLVVKSQPTDIIDIILCPIKRPNGVYMACSVRKSGGSYSQQLRSWGLPLNQMECALSWG